MNGAQDLGGMMGFGPVVSEADEPAFHCEWEKRAFALTLAMGATGTWSIDKSRFERESLPPAQYLSSSYYQLWLAGVERLCLGANLITDQELSEGKSLQSSAPVKRVLKAEDVEATLMMGGPATRPETTKARFSVGDVITAKNIHPEGHTRIPRYVRGRTGTIEAVHGVHVLPDTSAMGHGEAPTWLYGVAFKGTELWGEHTDPTLTVRVDLWETYLDDS